MFASHAYSTHPLQWNHPKSPPTLLFFSFNFKEAAPTTRLSNSWPFILLLFFQASTSQMRCWIGLISRKRTFVELCSRTPSYPAPPSIKLNLKMQYLRTPSLATSIFRSFVQIHLLVPMEELNSGVDSLSFTSFLTASFNIFQDYQLKLTLKLNRLVT